MRVGILPFLLALSGCGSLYWEDTPAPPAISGPGVRASPNLWLADCKDPLAQQLIETLLEQNIDLKIAQSRVAEARGMLRVAGAGFFPEISATSTGFRGNSTPSNTSSVKPYGLLQGGLNTTWDLDLFGATRADVRRAHFGVAASVADQENIKLSLLAEMFTTLISWRQVKETLQETQAQVAFLDRQVAVVGAQVGAGLVEGTVLESTRALREKSASQLPLLQAALKKSQFALEKLLGHAPESLAPLLEKDQTPLAPPGIGVTLAIPMTVVRNRPDVRGARAQMLGAQAELEQAEANLWPKLTLGNFFGVQSVSNSGLIGNSNPLWSLTAGLTAPLLEFGRLRGAVDTARAKAQEAYWMYENTVLGALQDIHTAFKEYTEGLQAVQRLQLTLLHQEAAVQTSAKRFQAGLTDQLTTLAAQSMACQASLDLIAQKALTAQAFVRLQKALNAPLS